MDFLKLLFLRGQSIKNIEQSCSSQNLVTKLEMYLPVGDEHQPLRLDKHTPVGDNHRPLYGDKHTCLTQMT